MEEKKIKSMHLIKSLIHVVLLFAALNCFSQTASEIVKKSEERMRGNTLKGTMSIKTMRPAWSREMVINMWLKGNDFALILVKSPEKDKGITYLKRKKEVWNWMPVLEKTIKLPPSMMSQSWMGTDFSNDYLVKQSSLETDFDSKLSIDSIIDSKPCWKVILKPKEDAAVVWGKVILFIDKKDFLQLRNEYYDEDGELVNMIHAYNVKKMGGRFIPTTFEMIPSDKPGNKTIINYQALEFELPLEDSFFTTNNMKQVK